MLRARPAAALATTVVLISAAAPAAGASAESGVSVDHDSPSAKEYAVPLDQARQDASDGTSGAVSPEPFGAGVGDDASAARAGTTTTSTTRPAKRKRKHKRSGEQPERKRTRTVGADDAATVHPARSVATVPDAASPSEGTSSTVVLAGGGGLVAAVGVASALWVRRRPGGRGAG